jgi:dihydroxyacetone kinase-like predicted kinase
MAVKVTGVDGQLFKRALLGSLTWLASNHEEVNRLNVFPFPDGDTGTNMLLTLQSAVEDVKESNAAEVSKIAKLASHGSLMGARGNSGVILSQIFRGFARAVEGKSSLTPAELAAAFEEAANAAYRAVNKPTEGTILTVAREAGRAASTAAGGPTPVPQVIAAAAAGARAASAEDAEPAQILREAGVVDAGGFGLQLISRACSRRSKSQIPLSLRSPRQEARRHACGPGRARPPRGRLGLLHGFLIQGTNLDTDLIRGQIESLGNSVLVVGERARQGARPYR